VTDWSGEDYAEVSALQRAMIGEARSALMLAERDHVLDVGCGDGYLAHQMAGMVPDGFVIGVDASKRMVGSASTADRPTGTGPWFVVGDARALPFGRHFDVVVSFNALHWVREQQRALAQIAAVLLPRGRAVIQVVCAGERPSLEAVTMTTCRSPRWADRFDGVDAPFVHVDPATYADLAASVGLMVTDLAVTDREWDFDSRDRFHRWSAVGCTAWTDRLPVDDRDEFIADQIRAYEPVAGRPGLFRFTQMRAELRAEPGTERVRCT
jgi:trans-aconitate 2-methyltransferase